MLAAVIAFCTFFPQIKNTGYKQMYPIKYEDIVKAEAKNYGLAESLVYGVIKTESGFDPQAESSAQAKGLMQLTEGSFTWMQQVMGTEGSYEDGSIFEPEINIRYGCALLNHLITYFENIDTALAAYNAGIGNVSSWLENPEYSADGKTLVKIPFEETENYVNRVNSAAENYRRLYSIE